MHVLGCLLIHLDFPIDRRYWQPIKSGSYDGSKSPEEKMQLKVYCADGGAPLNATVVPGDMLCGYQDPYCLGVEQAGVQC